MNDHQKEESDSGLIFKLSKFINLNMFIGPVIFLSEIADDATVYKDRFSLFKLM